MALTLREKNQLKRLLARITYPLSSDIFYFISKTFSQVAVETVVWRRGTRGIEVLLLRRPPSDPFWPNLWHVPGSILRNRERFGSVFTRIEKEFGAKFAEKPRFAGVFNFTELKRGHVVSLVYCAKIGSSPKQGLFFSLKKLPRDFIPEHRGLIKTASKFLCP